VQAGFRDEAPGADVLLARMRGEGGGVPTVQPPDRQSGDDGGAAMSDQHAEPFLRCDECRRPCSVRYSWGQGCYPWGQSFLCPDCYVSFREQEARDLAALRSRVEALEEAMKSAGRCLLDALDVPGDTIPKESIVWAADHLNEALKATGVGR
jgi:hypothetical protein